MSKEELGSISSRLYQPRDFRGAEKAFRGVLGLDPKLVTAWNKLRALLDDLRRCD